MKRISHCDRCGGHLPLIDGDNDTDAPSTTGGECPGHISPAGNCGCFDDDDLAAWVEHETNQTPKHIGYVVSMLDGYVAIYAHRRSAPRAAKRRGTVVVDWWPTNDGPPTTSDAQSWDAWRLRQGLAYQ